MARFYIRVGIYILLVMFSVFLGVSLASSGMESIHGSIPSAAAKSQASAIPASSKGNVDRVKESAAVKTNASAQTKRGESELAAKAKAEETAKGRAASEAQPAVQPSEVKDSRMNHVGNKLGSLLQIIAHHGIRSFIAIFDTVLGKG